MGTRTARILKLLIVTDESLIMFHLFVQTPGDDDLTHCSFRSAMPVACRQYPGERYVSHPFHNDHTESVGARRSASV